MRAQPIKPFGPRATGAREKFRLWHAGGTPAILARRWRHAGGARSESTPGHGEPIGVLDGTAAHRSGLVMVADSGGRS
jgi:hypothetical protein